MNEVVSVVDVSQFAAGHSQDKCGFYVVGLLNDAGKPGASPIGTPLSVTRWADAEYIAYDGPDTSSNNNGMTVAMLYAVINDAGLHYQAIGARETGYHVERLTATYIRAWLKIGYPAVLAVAEDNVVDLDLGGNPYAWNTSGLYHIILCTGVDTDGNLLCHDTASIDSNGVRPGPRRYDAGQLQAGLTSATAVVMPWLQRPQGDFDPTQEDGMYHFLSIGEQGTWFKQHVAGQDDAWQCIQNGVVLGGAHLNYFRWNGGVVQFGLPLTSEMQLDSAHHPEVTAVKYERGVNFYDPNTVFDHPPMDAAQPEKRVYRAHIEGGQGLQILAGTQLSTLQAQLAVLQEQVKQLQSSAAVQAVQALTAKLNQIEVLAKV